MTRRSYAHFLTLLPRLLVLGALVSLLGCSSGPPPGPERTSHTTGEEPPATSSPWDELDQAALAALVEAGAVARIREVEPDLAIDELDAWLAEPERAPMLGDRVSEQLVHLAIAAAARGEDDRAVRLVRLVRAKARNRNNAFTGPTLLSELARRSAESEPASAAAVHAALDELPRNRFGGATVVYQLFQNTGQIDGRIEQLHGQLVSLDTAVSVLFYDAILRPIVEHRGLFMSVIEQIQEARAEQPDPDPYPFSTVDLTRARDANEVRVAVWDTGVEGSLFEGQLFSAADGSHGVIADPTEGQTGLTFQPSAETITEYAPFLQGIMDLRAGLASTEAAQRVLALMGSAQSARALDELGQNLDQIGEWAHGTHVAGILLAGLPQARVAVFRSAWAGEARLYHHRGPTDEELAAERANVEAIARFINDNEIRVVNASLGFAEDYVEGELRHESERYATDSEVRARAREVQRHRRESWSHVFEQCPRTLFVVAAGNSNRDIVEYGDVPSSLLYDNLLVVGAVDRFGDWATFTNSNPERVTVFDHGVEVPSVIPNGETLPLSGTSMAAPNVANLAAKMISVAPSLGPAETIAIIRETGEPIDAPFYGRIAHEERAIARARRQRRR